MNSVYVYHYCFMRQLENLSLTYNDGFIESKIKIKSGVDAENLKNEIRHALNINEKSTCLSLALMGGNNEH